MPSDLEFNAPNSLMQQIRVERSVFRHNLCAGPGAGWGVGFANVQQSVIRGNSFVDYGMNAIHIEDRSANLHVDANTFVQCSTIVTSYDSNIIIISGCRSIAVSGNMFDCRSQPNTIDCVYVGAGGAYTPPQDITITNNTAYLAHGSQVVGVYNAINVIAAPNVELA